MRETRCEAGNLPAGARDIKLWSRVQTRAAREPRPFTSGIAKAILNSRGSRKDVIRVYYDDLAVKFPNWERSDVGTGDLLLLRKLVEKLRYMHRNPVKHGLVLEQPGSFVSGWQALHPVALGFALHQARQLLLCFLGQARGLAGGNDS